MVPCTHNILTTLSIATLRDQQDVNVTEQNEAASASATPDQFEKPSSPPPALPQPALSRLQLPPKPSPTPPAAIVGPHLPRQAGPAGPWPPTSSFSAGQPLPPPPFTLASPQPPPPAAPVAPPRLLPNRTAKAQHPSLLQPADLPQKQPSDIFSDEFCPDVEYFRHLEVLKKIKDEEIKRLSGKVNFGFKPN